MVESIATEPKLLGAGQDEGDASVQDLKIALAHMKFDLQKEGLDPARKQAIMGKAEEAIAEHKMSGVYQLFCSQLGWTVDSAKLDELRAANAQDIKELDDKIDLCGQNEGDEEVRNAMLEKADYLCNIGDKEQAWKAYEAVEKKSPGANHKLTIAFCKIRLEMLLGNWSDIKKLLEDAKQVCEQGGDWEKKNRLMVYEAVYFLAQRQFSRAAKLFLASVATFTTYELFDYETCIFYTIVTSIITLPRLELKKQVVEASEVRTVIHKLPGPQRLLHSLYDCDYQEFFPGFLNVAALLEADMFLASHVRYFMREARAVVYAQYLASYKSVTIVAMAKAFGVSPAFLDEEVSDFIVASRLNAKIDKAANVIETAPSFERTTHYQALIKEGDLLLNRLQKLSKIVDVE